MNYPLETNKETRGLLLQGIDKEFAPRKRPRTYEPIGGPSKTDTTSHVQNISSFAMSGDKKNDGTNDNSTTSATGASDPSAVKKQLEKMLSPQDFFKTFLKSRGYPASTFCSLDVGYHNQPTKHQLSSYGIALTNAIRSSDGNKVRNLLKRGLSPNACNKFNESIVHAVCRRGDYKLLRILIEAGSSVQISDDFGRTPLHDACWTSSPNFDTVSLLLEQDPWLLCIEDKRGSTPLSYARKAHWASWIGFLMKISNDYWPPIRDDGECDEPESQKERPTVPPLSLVKPNSAPLPCPDGIDTELERIQLIASGKLIESPESSDASVDSSNDSSVNQGCRPKGITLDTLLSNRSLSTRETILSLPSPS